MAMCSFRPLIFFPLRIPHSLLSIWESMGVGSKGKRERARGLMGSDFCRILPRLAPEGKDKKRGFEEGVQLPNRSPFCLSARERKMR